MLRRYRDDPARSGVRQDRSASSATSSGSQLDEARHVRPLRQRPALPRRPSTATPSAEPGRHFDLSARSAEGLRLVRPTSSPPTASPSTGSTSCFLNDRHWTGAAISRESIANAAAHAAEFADGFLRIAVWHHGIHTDGYPPRLPQPGRPRRPHRRRLSGRLPRPPPQGRRPAARLAHRPLRPGRHRLPRRQSKPPPRRRSANNSRSSQIHPHQVHVQVFERTGDSRRLHSAAHARTLAARPLRASASSTRSPPANTRAKIARRPPRHHRPCSVRISELRTPVADPRRRAQSRPVCEARARAPHRAPPASTDPPEHRPGRRDPLHPLPTRSSQHRPRVALPGHPTPSRSPSAEVPRYNLAIARRDLDGSRRQRPSLRSPHRPLPLPPPAPSTYSFDDPVVDHGPASRSGP